MHWKERNLLILLAVLISGFNTRFYKRVSSNTKLYFPALVKTLINFEARCNMEERRQGGGSSLKRKLRISKHRQIDE